MAIRNRGGIEMRVITRVLLLVLPVLLGVERAAGAEPVVWRSGAAEIADSDRADVTAQVLALAARSDERHVVVQFDEPVSEIDRDRMSRSGLTLLRPLGSNAYFAAISGETGVLMPADLGLVRGVRAVQRAWKLAPAILADRVPDWAVVAEDARGDRMVGVYVLFHADVPLRSEAAEAVKRHGGVIRDTLNVVNGLVVELPLSEVRLLADEDAVQWIEWPLPPMSVVNNSNRALTGADIVNAAPYNLDGDGITVMVYDGGTVRDTHVDFEGRVTVLDGSGEHDHPTHVAGTVGGAGIANSARRGMAPEVTILSYGLETDGTDIFLYSNPGDIEDDYTEAIYTYGADVSNNSIGTNTEPNGFDCDIQGDYGVTANLIDSIVRGSLGDPFRVIWANGNERQGDRCDVEGYGDYYSTAPPAGAKNHITVGAINSDDESMTDFSSWGPVDDGRLKPDISAPGCEVGDDGGVTSCSASSDTSYTTMCGTSMAAPTVTGLTALFLQDFRAQFPGVPDPRNSTLKAVYAQTAVDLGANGPDYKFGYGSVRIQDAIDLMRDSAFIERDVSDHEIYTFEMDVEAGTPELKITLAWDDYPATPNVATALVNDLDLQVYSPSSTQYYPWTLNPSSPSVQASRTQADHVNNIEQVLVDNPEAGRWTVEVFGYSVPEGPQPFSLAGDGVVNSGMWITVSDDLPEVVAPGVIESFEVQIATLGESYVADSGTLHYRYDGGTWQTLPLVSLGSGLFRADLPAPQCGDTPEYYVSAEGTVSGVSTKPSNAPAATYSFQVGEYVTVLEDDFETDMGWTVDAGASTGNWERADPEEVTSGWLNPVITQPEDDHTSTGTLCYVTQAAAGSGAGSYDVDGGPSHLTSPMLDLTAGDPYVSYWRWYHISTEIDDSLVVAISNNDGADWVTVETISARQTWTYAEWRAADYVTPTTEGRVRFTVNDTDPGSLIESLIDDFTVRSFQCISSESCTDGIQNQGEDRIDCGGPCPACECTSDAACSDGAFCTGVETCDSYGNCLAGSDPCPGQSCDEVSDTCVACENDGDCDNGLFCDGVETCDGSGVCQPGATVDCDDAVDCTDDSCNETTDTCDNIPNDSLCNNGSYCDGVETCHVTLGCQAGTEVDCDDLVDCTDDSCSDALASCQNIPNDGLCDNGEFCDGTETCDPVVGCEDGAMPCVPEQMCRESDDQCVDCLDNSDCEDGDPCTGEEVCDPDGTCGHVLAADCNANGVEDSCDIDAGTSEDCNVNGVPDECDVSGGGSSDTNGNGVPDECEVNPPVGAPSPYDTTTNRYISFAPNNTTINAALRVVMTASDFFPESIGTVGWVGEPDAEGIARIIDEAHYSNSWPAVVHVGDCQIVPAAAYEVAATSDGGSFSSALAVSTTPQPAAKYWTDCVGEFTGVWGPPNGLVNLNDMMAAIQKFQHSSTAPPLTWVDVDGVVPNTILNMTDVQVIVNGFKGEPYPFDDPADCP